MADNDRIDDILGQDADAMEQLQRGMNRLNSTMEKILGAVSNMSQANARDTINSERDKFQRAYRDRQSAAKTPSGKSVGSRSFGDAFHDALSDGLISSDFRNRVAKEFKWLADGMGVSVKGLPETFGRELGSYVATAFKKSKLGSSLSNRLSKLVDDQIKQARAGFMRGIEKYDARHQTSYASQFTANVESAARTPSGTTTSSFRNMTQSTVADTASRVARGSAGGLGDVAAQAVTQAVSGGVGGAGLLAGSKGALSAIGPKGLLLAAAIEKVTDAFGPLVDGFKEFMTALKDASERDEKSRKENIKYAKQRMMEDMETLIKEPFNILKAAAEEVYNAWDNTLRVISATQGYTKSDVQDLMSVFAERLRKEGLTDVVSGTNIIENLSKVLQAGLSGKVAEEFAYQASILQAAYPTQDFFQYAEQYSSIAANAIKNGKSQNAAIALATKELKAFANNTLYASRELAGGFSTGLKDASTLYAQAVKIAQAARIESPSEIAGVFTSVAATVGAIAPDLATSITDAVYSAAVGGNSSQLVALRSLAGVNASNTEFLQALAKNPQKIFATLFENLANMYTQSSDAYMEKAEGYAELFGLSAEAFQRVDFKYLADAINNMNTSSGALAENMEMLQSGQTTLTQEQLKNREINKYMIDEGLSYVLDNEAARSIQEHMWNEQIARNIMEATYGIELKGKSLSLLEAIKSSVGKVLNFLNPFSWFKKIDNITASNKEAAAIDVDVSQLLELGKVGKGNALQYQRLITRGLDLGLATPLVNMLGGQSAYQVAAAQTQTMQALANPLHNSSLAASPGQLMQMFSSGATTGPKSKYAWSQVSKLQGAARTSFASLQTPVETMPTTESAATQSAQSSIVSKIEQMLSSSYLDKYLGSKTYEDWAASAKSLGIADFAAAIESAGYTESQLQDFFESKEMEKGTQELARQQQKEESFWDNAIKFYSADFPKDFRDPLFEKLDQMITNQTDWAAQFTAFDGRHMQKLELIEAVNRSFRDGWNRWAGAFGENNWAAYFKNSNRFWGERGAFQSFLTSFTDYFITHKIYDEALGGSKYYDRIKKVQAAEKSESGDAIYSLADALTQNTTELKDPTVQTNALLAQILQVVSAIMNQNNESAGTLSLGDTLSALALGMTNRS